MLKIKQLIENLPVSAMEKQVIEQMLSDAYANIHRRCEVLPEEWGIALTRLFEELNPRSSKAPYQAL